MLRCVRVFIRAISRLTCSPMRSAWILSLSRILIATASPVSVSRAYLTLAKEPSPIVFPMVPKGTARVRVIVSASFSKDDCDAGLAAFKKVAADLSG